MRKFYLEPLRALTLLEVLRPSSYFDAVKSTWSLRCASKCVFKSCSHTSMLILVLSACFIGKMPVLWRVSFSRVISYSDFLLTIAKGLFFPGGAEEGAKKITIYRHARFARLHHGNFRKRPPLIPHKGCLFFLSQFVVVLSQT